MNAVEPTAEQKLQALQPGQEIKVCRIAPHGSLYARKDSTGTVMFTWRWTHQGINDRERIGPWDPDADIRRITRTAAGWTVQAAIRAAEEWALEHERTLPEGGFREAFAKIQQAEAKAQATLSHHSLGQLMEDYALYLEKKNSHDSAYDVRGAVRKNIELMHNEIYHMPAMQVGRDEIMKIISTINQPTGFRRLSQKIRTFLRTAYQLALTAESNPDLPKEFKTYRITHNPVDQVGNPQPLKTNVPRSIKALDYHEMRIYWDIIRQLPGLEGAVLRLHLLTGGPRLRQLVRLLVEDIQPHQITLYDIKGRGNAVRLHPLPLTDLARQALLDCQPRGRYALSSGNGSKHIDAQTPTKWAQAAVRDVFPEFKLKWVRSGVETLLTTWRVPKENRGRLQSHGIGGTQDRHYVAAEFYEHSLEALEILEAVLTGKLQRPPKRDIVAILQAQELAQAQALQ